MRFLRLLRGVASTAIVWAIAWATLGAVISPLLALASPIDPPARFYIGIIVGSTVFYGIVGLWSGAVFAVTMAISERRRVFTDLSMSRVVAWGVLGGISYPLLALLFTSMSGAAVGGLAVALGITAALGAGSAWAMLRAARRAAEPVLDRAETPASLRPPT